MGLLEKFLNKRGVKDPEELDNTPMPDGSLTERQTFDNWRAILSKDELTLEDIKHFCERQIAVIEGKWADLNIEQARKAEMIPIHTVYKALLLAIDSPRSAREALEQQLEQLTK